MHRAHDRHLSGRGSEHTGQNHLFTCYQSAQRAQHRLGTTLLQLLLLRSLPGVFSLRQVLDTLQI